MATRLIALHRDGSFPAGNRSAVRFRRRPTRLRHQSARADAVGATGPGVASWWS